jgi:hypothetical protein
MYYGSFCPIGLKIMMNKHEDRYSTCPMSASKLRRTTEASEIIAIDVANFVATLFISLECSNVRHPICVKAGAEMFGNLG